MKFDRIGNIFQITAGYLLILDINTTVTEKTEMTVGDYLLLFYIPSVNTKGVFFPYVLIVSMYS